MKKKIAIFGSTGSIGKSLINIIKKDKKINDRRTVSEFLFTNPNMLIVNSQP